MATTVFLVILCGIVGIVVLTLQRAMMYPAPPIAIQPRFPGATLLRVEGPSGRTNIALYNAASGGSPTIVYFHGNAEQLADAVPLGQRFATSGLGFLAVEYPGYGLAAGSKTTEARIFADASAILDHATSHLGVASEDMVLVGRSLGTGVAVEMARRGFGGRVVLISAYTSMADMAGLVVPLLPVSLLIRDRYDSLAKSHEVRQPVLVIHGAADEIIPVRMGRELAARLPRARFLELAHARHNDLFLVGGDPLVREIAAFATGAQDSAARQRPPTE